MRNIGKLIKQHRIKKGYSQEYVAEKLRVNKSTISRWERGDIISIKLESMIGLAKLLEVSIASIMGWEETPAASPNFFAPSFEYDFVPYGISAGAFDTIEPMFEFEKLSVPNEFMGKYAQQKDILLTYVSGESMNNVIDNGALIAIKRNVSPASISNGDIVAIATENGYSVKRFFNDEENKRYVFQPDSSINTFLPLVVPYGEPIHLVGKVVMYSVWLE